MTDTSGSGVEADYDGYSRRTSPIRDRDRDEREVVFIRQRAKQSRLIDDPLWCLRR